MLYYIIVSHLTMSYYCKNACGQSGPPGKSCTFMCLRCCTSCTGKFANSFKESIGKNQFYCHCDNGNETMQAEKSNKRICVTL